MNSTVMIGGSYRVGIAFPTNMSLDAYVGTVKKVKARGGIEVIPYAINGGPGIILVGMEKQVNNAVKEYQSCGEVVRNPVITKNQRPSRADYFARKAQEEIGSTKPRTEIDKVAARIGIAIAQKKIPVSKSMREVMEETRAEEMRMTRLAYQEKIDGSHTYDEAIGLIGLNEPEELEDIVAYGLLESILVKREKRISIASIDAFLEQHPNIELDELRENL